MDNELLKALAGDVEAGRELQERQRARQSGRPGCRPSTSTVYSRGDRLQQRASFQPPQQKTRPANSAKGPASSPESLPKQAWDGSTYVSKDLQVVDVMMPGAMPGAIQGHDNPTPGLTIPLVNLPSSGEQQVIFQLGARVQAESALKARLERTESCVSELEADVQALRRQASALGVRSSDSCVDHSSAPR